MTLVREALSYSVERLTEEKTTDEPRLSDFDVALAKICAYDNCLAES